MLSSTQVSENQRLGRSENCVDKGSKHAHWIGLYLSFNLSWVLGPFVHGRLQYLRTSEVTFDHEKRLQFQDDHESLMNQPGLQQTKKSTVGTHLRSRAACTFHQKYECEPRWNRWPSGHNDLTEIGLGMEPYTAAVYNISLSVRGNAPSTPTGADDII